MGKLNINNGGVDTNKKMPDIDERFGPYTSKEAADAALGGQGRNTITAGLTVGILTANAGVKEYWYQPNKKSGQLELIPKGSNAADNPTEGNFSSFDENGNVVDSGNKASDFAPIEQAVPNGDTEDVGKILEKQANGFGWIDKPVDGDDAYGVYVKQYDEQHPDDPQHQSEDFMSRDEWLEYNRGKSAREIYNKENNTNYNDAQFIEAIKSNYPMKYVEYDSNAYGASNPSSISSITPSATTEGKLWFMPNNDNTETKLFITVNNGTVDEPDYDWYNMGVVDVPNNVLTEEMVDNECVDGATDEPASAKAVMDLKAKLEGVTASESKATPTSTGDVGKFIKPDNTEGSVSGWQWGEFNVAGCKSVRFLALDYISSTNPSSGWLFLDDSDNIKRGEKYTHTADSTTTKELVIPVPEGATKFKTNIAGNALTDNFYCYLQSGDTVKDTFNQQSNEINRLNVDVYGDEGVVVNDTYTDELIVSSDVQFSDFITLDTILHPGVRYTYTLLQEETITRGIRVYFYNQSKQQVTRPGAQNDYISISASTGTISSGLLAEDAYYIKIMAFTNVVNAGAIALNIYANSSQERKVAYISDINELIEGYDPSVYVELHPFALEKSISSTTGLWVSTSNNQKLHHCMIPVVGGERFVVTKGSALYFRYAFIDDADTPTFVSGTKLEQIQEDRLTILIPKGTHFLYLQFDTENTNYRIKPASIRLLTNEIAYAEIKDRVMNEKVISMNHYPPAVDREGFDIVDNVQIINAKKKGDQLRLVGFTPKRKIPARYTDISENVSRISVPYSSNNDDLKLVGLQVSLHTFMTAINNPYSLMYTERCNADNSKSAWGKVYDSTNAWSYYGTVCCGLTSSVYGKEFKIHNGVIGRPYRDFGEYVKLATEGQVDWNNIKVGDIGNRYSSVHSFMIYDIKRDQYGTITNVCFIESSSGVTASESGNGTGGIRLSNYTKSQFETFMSTGRRPGSTSTAIEPYTLYRYVLAFNNTKYEASEFVAVGDEPSVEQYQYNNEICTYAGDKATFAKGDLVVLNYDLDGNHPMTSIDIYKDDDEPTSFTLAQANKSYDDMDEGAVNYRSMCTNGFNVIDQYNHALVLGTNLEPGKYKACYNGSDNFTYWEVVDTDTRIIKIDDNSYRLVFNGEPSVVYFPCFTEHGSLKTYVIQEANYDERIDRSMIIHPKMQYVLSRYYTYPYGNSIRVSIKGDYGIATSGVIDIESTQE